MQVANPEDACFPISVPEFVWLHDASPIGVYPGGNPTGASTVPSNARAWVALIIRSQGQESNCTFDVKVWKPRCPHLRFCEPSGAIFLAVVRG